MADRQSPGLSSRLLFWLVGILATGAVSIAVWRLNSVDANDIRQWERIEMNHDGIITNKNRLDYLERLVEMQRQRRVEGESLSEGDED